MIDPIVSQARVHMTKAIEFTRQDLSSIRSGRATPALVENITVPAYGGTQYLKVQALATITTADSKSLVISPFDVSIINEIAKAIQEANTGLTPSVDGEVIRIGIPPLSQERRQEYTKLARVKVEAGKVMVRQGRADAMKELKKLEVDKAISEDEQKHGERLVQELTDEMIAELETMGDRKEEELMQI
jgi:ribosome recycling factor